MNPGTRTAPRDGGADADTRYQHPEDYSEDATTVGKVVAAILDSHLEDEGRPIPRELQDVFKLRAATRRVLEAGLRPGDEDRLLRALARQAAHATLSLWVLEAMEREILGPDAPELLPPDAVARSRTLRSWGHGQCPTCRQSLISEPEIDRDNRRRKWDDQDQAIHRSAVRAELAS